VQTEVVSCECVRQQFGTEKSHPLRDVGREEDMDADGLYGMAVLPPKSSLALGPLIGGSDAAAASADGIGGPLAGTGVVSLATVLVPVLALRDGMSAGFLVRGLSSSMSSRSSSSSPSAPPPPPPLPPLPVVVLGLGRLPPPSSSSSLSPRNDRIRSPALIFPPRLCFCFMGNCWEPTKNTQGKTAAATAAARRGVCVCDVGDRCLSVRAHVR
jgi:hypothetical protein